MKRKEQKDLRARSENARLGGPETVFRLRMLQLLPDLRTFERLNLEEAGQLRLPFGPRDAAILSVEKLVVVK